VYTNIYPVVKQQVVSCKRGFRALACDSRGREFNSQPFRKLFTHDWEGNRRSGVALAVLQRLKWFTTYGLKA